MRLAQNLVITTQQKLMITPALRQAIAILQMSTMELDEYLKQAIEENPLLEEQENLKNAEDYDETEKEPQESKDNTEEWLDVFRNREKNTINKNEAKAFENFVSTQPSLYEHLLFQLRVTIHDKLEMDIGEYIIGSIDNKGYLQEKTSVIAKNVPADIEQVEKVLAIIQTFHPQGVGARDLKECLLLQLKYQGKNEPLYEFIISNHLQDLGKGRLNKIARASGESIATVQQACDFIRNLNPRPGLQYSNKDEIKYIIPDITVEKIEGEYILVVNDGGFPKLMVNEMYEDMLKQPHNFNEETKKYLEDKMGAAIWLIKCIDQRRLTLLKVANCIVELQKEFIDKGVRYLQPLTLKDVAELLGIHESTVSRATSNKYIQTPQGLFEMKYFFSSAVESSLGNQSISSTSIKDMIEEIIAHEDSLAPYSDQAIANILEKKGINLSRRTVTKYRQEMGILSTVARKRYTE